jgi:transposase
VVAVTIQPADQGDTETVKESLITAAENVEAVKPESDVIRELVADKGYHSNDLLKDLTVLGIRSTLPSRGWP